MVNTGTLVALIPGESLYDVTYSCEGGEDGGVNRLELTRRPDGGGTLEQHFKQFWNDQEKTSTCQVDATAFEELERIVKDYDLRLASERPDSGLYALDAPTETICFSYVGDDEELTFDPDQMYSIAKTQELTDHEREGCQAVRAALEALLR